MDSRTDKILRWIIIGALNAAVIVPLIVSSFIFFPYITGKNFAFRILIEIAFAAYLILAFRRPEYRPRKSPMLISIGIFITALLISVLLSEDPYKSFWSNFERMEGFIGIAHFALAFLVAGSVFKINDWKRIAVVSICVNAIIIFYAFLQSFGLFSISQGGARVDSTFGNAIYLGIYSLFHIFIALLAVYYVASEKKKKIFLWLFGASAVCNLIIIFLTSTRGIILGLFVGVLAVCLLAVFSRSATSVFKKSGIIGLVILSLSVCAFFVVKNNEWLRSNKFLGRVVSVSLTGEDAQTRFIVWKIALHGFAEHPVFGLGQENFSLVFNKHYDPRLYSREAWFDRAHNSFLDWLVAAGILGFSGYILLWFFALKTIFTFPFAERAILFGFFISYAVNNIFVFDNGVSVFFFFMLLAYLHYRKAGSAKDNLEIVSQNNSHNKIAGRIYAPVVIVALILAMYYANARPAYAGNLLLKALRQQTGGLTENLSFFKKALSLNTFANAEISEQLVQVSAKIAPTNVPVSVKQEFFTAAADSVSKIIEERPEDARYYSFMGSLLDAFGVYEQGFVYWKKALEYSPNKQVLLYQAGINRIKYGDQKEAVKYFKDAYELLTENRDAAILYAAALIYTGDRAGEKKIMSTPVFVNSGGFDDARIMNAYEAVGRIDESLALWKALLKKHPDNQYVKDQIKRLSTLKNK